MVKFFPAMNRIPEPEIMSGHDQAQAYYRGDFADAHEMYVRLFAEVFPARPATATVLDLGCGPCDVTIRFARANPEYTIHAVDGSAAMLDYARQALERAGGLESRIRLIEGYIPGAPIPLENYDAILSNNFLHHLHEPRSLWQTVRRYSKVGTLLFVTDLFRPASQGDAETMVEKYSATEPVILKRDFFNSLLAAFTVEEVRHQLAGAKLDFLQIKTISDRHFIVFGKMQ